MLRYCHAAACRGLIITMCLMVALSAAAFTLKFPGAVAMLVCFWLWKSSRTWRGSGSSHGSARWVRLDELLRANMLGDDGLILGTAELAGAPPRAWALRALFSPLVASAVAIDLFLAALLPSRWKCPRLIRLKRPVHLLTVAGTGRGKSTKVFIVQLLSVPIAMVVIDPKCELFQKTSTHRSLKFRHRSVRVDPFGLDGTAGDSLNPLDFVDATASDFLDACRDVAMAIVVMAKDAREPHWDEAAAIIITAAIVYVCACEKNPGARSLNTVRLLLSARFRFQEMVGRMQKVEGFDAVVSKLGHMLSWFQGDELASVLTHVQRHMAFLDSPDVAACVATSSFHPRDLRSGRVTVYLCLPPTRLRSLAPLQRLWLSTILRELARGVPSEKNPVLFLIDEAAHIGHIEILENAVTLMRGAGIRLWFAFQSLGQLRECYGERAAVFLDNIDTQQYFGIGHDSAEALAKKLGDQTIFVESLNTSTSTSRPDGGAATTQAGQVSTSRSITLSEQGRALLRADEATRLDDSVGVVIHRNLPPIPVRLIEFFNFDGFKDGGTGEAPGVGTRAVIAAAAALVLVALGTLQVLRLPVAAPLPAPAMRPVMPAMPYGVHHMPPGYPQFGPPPVRRRPRTAVPVRRGYLIRVP